MCPAKTVYMSAITRILCGQNPPMARFWATSLLAIVLGTAEAMLQARTHRWIERTVEVRARPSTANFRPRHHLLLRGGTDKVVDARHNAEVCSEWERESTTSFHALLDAHEAVWWH